MRSFTHSSRLAIAAALCLAFSWPAHAVSDAYMKIEGAKQGQFKGEGTRQGSTQWIPVNAVNHSVQSPRDAASGLSSGKRQHQFLKVTKEWGAASPQLQKALEGNEQLKQVVIEFVRPGPQGKEEVYETMTLTDAVVAGIQIVHGTADKNTKQSEVISFSYEKIQMTHGQAQKTAQDDWTNKK
jgi:type VI secretion system secreted protein Hcp